jgi:hypothetical protein
MYIFDNLSSRVNSSNLLSLISINGPWNHTRAGDFLRVDFHRTNYGVHEPLNGAVRSFNEFAGLFELHLPLAYKQIQNVKMAKFTSSVTFSIF